jgi:hypothetical protein
VSGFTSWLEERHKIRANIFQRWEFDVPKFWLIRDLLCKFPHHDLIDRWCDPGHAPGGPSPALLFLSSTELVN